MAKKIYMDTLNGHINQCLANFVINKQLLAWDKNDFFDYKLMYPTLKT